LAYGSADAAHVALAAVNLRYVTVKLALGVVTLCTSLAGEFVNKGAWKRLAVQMLGSNMSLQCRLLSKDLATADEAATCEFLLLLVALQMLA
jgi:hypothetical protein